MSIPKVDRFIIKSFVLWGVKRFLASSPYYPLLSIQQIFDIIARDISRRVATKRQIGSVFYELIDAGKIPHLKGIRDRAVRRNRAIKKVIRSWRKMSERERDEKNILTFNAGISKTTNEPKCLKIHEDTEYNSSFLNPRPHLRKLYQKRYFPEACPLAQNGLRSTPSPSSRNLRDSPPKTLQIRKCIQNVARLRSSVPYKDQRELLESMHRLCLYSCFDFCKIRLEHDITRNIDDPISSLLGLSPLINVIMNVWNSGKLNASLIDEDVGFGSGNAFERAGCVVDSMIYKLEMSDRRLLSVLQAGEELLDALLDDARSKRADAIYRRAEKLIARCVWEEYGSAEMIGEFGLATGRDKESMEMEDEDA